MAPQRERRPPAEGLNVPRESRQETVFTSPRSLLGAHLLEVTTSAALLMTYGIGALVGLGHTFTPAASAILMTLLLAWKVELRRFADGVIIDELRGAVLLGLIGLVIYPSLPDRFIDRWELVNLRQASITVVVIAGISFPIRRFPCDESSGTEFCLSQSKCWNACGEVIWERRLPGRERHQRRGKQCECDRGRRKP